MRERIVLAPGLNAHEMQVSLARRAVDCLNMRICGAGELARLALAREGIALTQKVLDAQDETARIAEAMRDEAYFETPSYSDIQHVARTVRTMRSLVTGNDEGQALAELLPKGIFTEKNAALLGVYEHYMQIVAREDAIDYIALIRLAACQCSPIDADFIALDEWPLAPLERVLLERVSQGRFETKRTADLFEAADQPLQIESFTCCYGASCEVQAILEDVFCSKRLDQCTVAVADAATYSQLFFDQAVACGIPITFGCGIPIANSNPARLLKLYHHWCTEAFFGPTALNAMLESDVFDRRTFDELVLGRDEGFARNEFWQALGALRLTNDAATNAARLHAFEKAVRHEAALAGDEETQSAAYARRRLSFVAPMQRAARELALPEDEFLARYARIRPNGSDSTAALVGALDAAALQTICSELKNVCKLETRQEAQDIVASLLQRVVCRQASKCGMLHVTEIDGALATVRDTLYVAGLCASNYPGAPKEDYLLLDADLDLFKEGAEHLQSASAVKRKTQRLMAAVQLACNLGAKVRVSYTKLDASELKEENASSLVFELYRRQHGASATADALAQQTEQVGYFDPDISTARFIGRAYNASKPVSEDAAHVRTSTPVSWSLDKAYSPSKLSAFFGCPRMFMLKNLLHIPEAVEDNDASFETISAIEAGNLAHALMELLGDTPMGKDEFMEQAAARFDRLMATCPALLSESVPAAKDEFLQMMKLAYENDSGARIALKEQDVGCTHESGVKLHGYPDRVEQLEDGSCLVVDFKTGKRIVQEENDVDTCLQVLVYATIMERLGHTVSGAEYRYLRYGTTIRCAYDDEMKRQLAARLETFKRAMLDGTFPLADADGNDEACKGLFCTYGDICGKGSESRGGGLR